jgi:hypothetical protein
VRAKKKLNYHFEKLNQHFLFGLVYACNKPQHQQEVGEVAEVGVEVQQFNVPQKDNLGIAKQRIGKNCQDIKQEAA